MQYGGQRMRDEELKMLKKQNFWMRLTALFMGGIFLVAVVSAALLVPKANSILSDFEATMEEVNEGVENLNETAAELANIDFEGLVDDTTKLIDDANEGILQAVEKIQAMDIEELNTAIKDLGSIVAPLAKLFGRS